MKTIQGKPMMAYHLRRLRKSEPPVIVATSQKEQFQTIVKFCQQKGILFYRGSKLNVLSRYHQKARKFEVESVIRSTSHYPLARYTYLGHMQSKFQKIVETYGTQEVRFSVLKEIGAGEFAHYILGSLDNARGIHLIRDARTVSASKYAADDPYPFRFLRRIWRILCHRHECFGERIRRARW